MEARILVVDDNPDSVTIMTSILEARGFTVAVATSGATALDIVKQSPPDVVLLDIMMPEMSGLEVLQQIKDDFTTGRTPVILVTAKTHDDDVVVGYQYGADYYITKPFTAKQLLYGIDLVLGKVDAPERGCLIAFEGGEGAGKSTHLRQVAASLRARGVAVIETCEPGGTPLGAELRQVLMHRLDAAPTALAELLLYLADRAQHVSQVLIPALGRGDVVLTDRFSASTIAYQAYARGLDLDMVRRLDAIARQSVEPRLTLVLDCPVEVGLPRAHGDDRFHREALAFHERVRAAFLTMAAERAERYCVIDATQPSATVQAAVEAAVLRCLNER